jgi:lipopolysaccharide biosynthesis regulator YciM
VTDTVENLMLEHLKRFQATLERIERDIGDLKVRQSDTHAAVIALRRDQVQDAEVTAHMQTRIDDVYARLDRIERRLELTH